MIITQKKPLEELLGMLDGAKTVALVGCGSCATACATGGEKEIADLTKVLEQHGMKVVATAMSEYCCMHLKTRTILKPVNAANPDAVVAMSCGDGVQVIAQYCKCPVYPSNNTMFLGESVKLGLFEEACHLCGDCVLGKTGGICPISRCAKSLVNGPSPGKTRAMKRFPIPGPSTSGGTRNERIAAGTGKRKIRRDRRNGAPQGL